MHRIKHLAIAGIITAVLGALTFASPAQAVYRYSKSQCDNMLMGASSTWAPDNDVNAAWAYYEARGIDIVAATTDYFAAWDGSGLRVGWWFWRRNGNKEYSIGRCWHSDTHHDGWISHSK